MADRLDHSTLEDPRSHCSIGTWPVFSHMWVAVTVDGLSPETLPTIAQLAKHCPNIDKKLVLVCPAPGLPTVEALIHKA